VWQGAALLFGGVLAGKLHALDLDATLDAVRCCTLGRDPPVFSIFWGLEPRWQRGQAERRSCA